MFHLLWELPTITAGEPHGLHAVHGAVVDALTQCFNWAASYPSTDTQSSAHTDATTEPLLSAIALFSE